MADFIARPYRPTTKPDDAKAKQPAQSVTYAPFRPTARPDGAKAKQPARNVTDARPRSSVAPGGADLLADADRFPGCTPYRASLEELDEGERRVEYWSAITQVAWVAEPFTVYHEKGPQRLAALMQCIAAERGSPIVCLGAADLVMRGPDGKPWKILEADQVAYLHPLRARMPEKRIVVGEHDLPDVVLEVDYTTDVRRGKLALYEEWGFAEVWVEVPDERKIWGPRARSPRARGPKPGLTIHLLRNGEFETSAESRAIPGWKAEEIHAALNEPVLSDETLARVGRFGAALGAREGAGPDDDPMLRRHRAEARAESQLKMVREILRRRGVVVPDARLVRLLKSGAASDEAVVGAALDCRDEADLLARLRRR